MTNAMASLTSAIGTVEREQTRRQFLHHCPVHGASKVFGIKTLAIKALRQLLPLLGHHLHQSQSIPTLEGSPQRIGEPLLNTLPGHETIDHHLDVVAVVLVQLNVVGKFAHLSVNADTGKTFGRQTADQLGVGSLLASHHR